MNGESFAFRWRLAACAAAAGAYATLLYLSSARSLPALGAAVALTPLSLVGLALISRITPRWIAVGAAGLLVVALTLSWPAVEQHHSLVVLLDQVGFHGLLGLTFGRTLRAGAVPLCTRLADLTHGPLDAATVRYTRQVTLAWTLLLLAIALASTLLYAFANRQVWSLFASFGPLVLLPALFIVEYALRWQRLPQLRGVHITAGVRAFMVSGSEASSRRA